MSEVQEPRCGHRMRSWQPCGRPRAHTGRHMGEAAYQKMLGRVATARRLGTAVVSTHGYGGYGNGCRCETYRAAKAAYHRERRAAAIKAARPGRVVEGVKHGTRFGYREKGCRCEPCVAFMRETWRRWDARKPEGAAA